MLLKVGDKAPCFRCPMPTWKRSIWRRTRARSMSFFFSIPRMERLVAPRKRPIFRITRRISDEQDCVLFGISRDECMKHAEFRDKEGIGTELLSDMEGVVCKQYGVWQAREVDGHRKFGIARSTFIIDKSGVIRHALYNVNYKGHALEVLRLVKELNS